MNKLQLLLKDEWHLLKEAEKMFLYSADTCSSYSADQKHFTMADADKMEAYTARFARLLDIYIQKILRLIDKIDLNEEGTLRDVINRAAKKGLVTDADKLVQLKIYRNEIAHDYIPANARNIFFEVRDQQNFLLECISMTAGYINQLLKG